jgi:uncharacterized membrane protein YdjX (TVP38/TMEM64 family)
LPKSDVATPQRDLTIPRSKGVAWLKAVIVVALLAALVLFGRETVVRLPDYAAWVQSLGAWGPAVFIAGYGIAAVVFVPAALLTFTAGALWGFRFGVVYVMLGATLGATLAFLTARHLVRRFVEAYVARHPKLAAIDRAVESEGARLVLLLRLSPIVPFSLLNYVLGISRVRFRDYMIGLVGMVPAASMYVYAGKVAGDLASVARGAATPHGPVYYAVLIVGLAATVVATVLLARASARAVEETANKGRAR